MGSEKDLARGDVEAFDLGGFALLIVVKADVESALEFEVAGSHALLVGHGGDAGLAVKRHQVPAAGLQSHQKVVQQRTLLAVGRHIGFEADVGVFGLGCDVDGSVLGSSDGVHGVAVGCEEIIIDLEAIEHECQLEVLADGFGCLVGAAQVVSDVACDVVHQQFGGGVVWLGLVGGIKMTQVVMVCVEAAQSKGLRGKPRGKAFDVFLKGAFLKLWFVLIFSLVTYECK